jgi:hypothetical protein
MRKKHLGLAVLLLVTAVLFSGCIKKSADKSATVNDEKNNQNQEQSQGQGNSQGNETVNPSGSYSINELFDMKRPMQCTWKESATGDSDVTNIMYINGKKFYQDVTMGDIGHSFTIFDGEYLYIWSDFNNVASKMKNTGATTSIKPGQESAGLDQKKNFVCEKWSADNSVFEPPRDKSFKDVTEEMNQVFEGLDEGDLEKAKQQACDMCQRAPTQALKNECLENAQCNQ